MAFRIHQQVVRGEIDNRIRGKVCGILWLAGVDEPVILDLKGNAAADLAGCKISFQNPDPIPGNAKLQPLQQGTTGEMSASRKVKILSLRNDGLPAIHPPAKQSYHMGNALYLEWFSTVNGRVVVESADFIFQHEDGPHWTLEADSPHSPANSMGDDETVELDSFIEEIYSDQEQEAGSMADWMDLLNERIMDRLQEDGIDPDPETYARIFREEREAMCRDYPLGEFINNPPDDGDSWEPEWDPDEHEQSFLETTFESAEDDDDDDPEMFDDHPLAAAASDLAGILWQQAEIEKWLPDAPEHDHPLQEILDNMVIATGRLVNATSCCEQWPPEKDIAPHVVHRLKQAHASFKSAYTALERAEAKNLANAQWRQSSRLGINQICQGILKLIQEARTQYGAE